MTALHSKRLFTCHPTEGCGYRKDHFSSTSKAGSCTGQQSSPRWPSLFALLGFCDGCCFGFFFSFLREDGGEILDDIQKWDSWWQRCHLISLQVVTCLKLLRTQSQTFLPRRVTVPGTWNSQTGLQRAEWGVRTAPASSPPARSPSASSLGKGYVTWLGRPG